MYRIKYNNSLIEVLKKLFAFDQLNQRLNKNGIKQYRFKLNSTLMEIC